MKSKATYFLPCRCGNTKMCTTPHHFWAMALVLGLGSGKCPELIISRSVRFN